MKRMVKNGDLIDVEPDGTITVAGKPVGGGGSSDDRNITLTISYSRGQDLTDNKTYVDDDIWNKIKECYYETIKIRYKDGSPLGIFNALYISIYQYGTTEAGSKNYIAKSVVLPRASSEEAWYGSFKQNYSTLYIGCYNDSTGKYIEIIPFETSAIPTLTKSKFDELYKLADKPTQDGTYVLKATVSGGAVTYTWVAQ